MISIIDSVNRQFISIEDTAELICTYGDCDMSFACEFIFDPNFLNKQLRMIRTENKMRIVFASYEEDWYELHENSIFTKNIFKKNKYKEDLKDLFGIDTNAGFYYEGMGFGRKTLLLTLIESQHITGIYLPEDIMTTADSYTGKICSDNPQALKRAYEELAKDTAKLQYELRTPPETFQHKITNQAPSKLEQAKSQIENTEPQPAPKNAPNKEARLDPRREKSLLQIAAIYAHMAKADTDQPYKQAEVLAAYAAVNGLECPSSPDTIADIVKKINDI